MSELVGNPEDRFSHNEAQILVYSGYIVGIDLISSAPSNSALNNQPLIADS